MKSIGITIDKSYRSIRTMLRSEFTKGGETHTHAGPYPMLHDTSYIAHTDDGYRVTGEECLIEFLSIDVFAMPSFCEGMVLAGVEL